jgi:OOP family OmpA-OmpF porin
MPALTLLTLNLLVLQGPQHLEFVPMETGVTIVQGISGDAYQGRDYEAVITIESAGRNLTLGSMAFVKDRSGVRRWLSVRRTVLAEDLRAARTMILGFDTDDAERLPGTTAMGPSRSLLDELRRNARLGTVVRNYAATPDNTGTLELVDRRPVAFPLLVNGLRVSVPAVHARGQLRGRGGARPWEFWFLDHPLQPLTLKVMYGTAGESKVGRPEWSRQIIRIDVPGDLADGAGENVAMGEAAGEAAGHGRALPATGPGAAVLAAEGGALNADGKAPTGAGGLPAGLEASAGGDAGNTDGAAAGAGAAVPAGGGAPISGAGDQARMGAGGGGLGMGAGLGAGAGAGAGAGMERRLVTQCRVSVPGIYFEFDSDVLNPASKPWIRSIADLVHRHPDWTITIEGHTDSVGTARYNHDLSTRRAVSLARSLTSQHGIASARLTTRGFGPDRPLESNATTEGRARNRRVELVRPCDRPTR